MPEQAVNHSCATGSGLYSAVLAVRVHDALRRNYRFVTTGASPMSRPILTHHGFQLLTYAYAHEWKGESEP